MEKDKWSSEKKIVKRYPNVNYNLMIKVYDWVLKNSNVVASPITNYTLLVNIEDTGNIFHLFLYLVLLYH